jgi:hypothetical protein
MWLYWMWTLIHSGILLLWSICISILYEPYIGNYIWRLKHMHIYIIWTIGYNIIWSIHYMMHGLYFNYLLWVAWFVFKAYIIWSICIYIYILLNYYILLYYYYSLLWKSRHYQKSLYLYKSCFEDSMERKFLPKIPRCSMVSQNRCFYAFFLIRVF